MTALYPPTQKAYAVKIIDKEPLVRRNLVKIAAMERNTLTHLANGQHPGITRLYWKFQDQWSWCQCQKMFLLHYFAIFDMKSGFRFHFGFSSKWQLTSLDQPPWLVIRPVLKGLYRSDN